MTDFDLNNLPETLTVTKADLTLLVQSLVKLEVAAQLEQLGGKRVARAPKFVRPGKLYGELQGHYFAVDLNALNEVDFDMAMRLLAVIDNEQAFPQENALARAMKAYTLQTQQVIMWAPNQEYLIVGNHRNGEKGRDELEKFKIPRELAVDLGHFSPNNEQGIAVGLIEVKNRIGFDAFVKAEMEEKVQEKMGEKLRKLGGRG